MELVLNLVWIVLATLMSCLWVRNAAHTGTDRRMQFVSLTLLILILFPVISVTDDLQASLNPAEVDSCLRRDHGCSNPHSIFPTVAALPLPVFADISFGILPIAALGNHPAPAIANSALAPIQNRPPPAA
jgi:hypothetical protein